jgi:hypothetical protein
VLPARLLQRRRLAASEEAAACGKALPLGK